LLLNNGITPPGDLPSSVPTPVPGYSGAGDYNWSTGTYYRFTGTYASTYQPIAPRAGSNINLGLNVAASSRGLGAPVGLAPPTQTFAQPVASGKLKPVMNPTLEDTMFDQLFAASMTNFPQLATLGSLKNDLYENKRQQDVILENAGNQMRALMNDGRIGTGKQLFEKVTELQVATESQIDTLQVTEGKLQNAYDSALDDVNRWMKTQLTNFTKSFQQKGSVRIDDIDW